MAEQTDQMALLLYGEGELTTASVRMEIGDRIEPERTYEIIPIGAGAEVIRAKGSELFQKLPGPEVYGLIVGPIPQGEE